MSDGDQNLIPVDPTVPYPLGRHQSHDPRNRAWGAVEIVEAAEPKARTRPWYSSVVFDQLNTSSCTAQAAVGLCKTQPHTARFTRRYFKGYDEHLERVSLYRFAQEVDPWPGSETTEPRYEGSSTDAPFRVLRNRGQIGAWRWLFGLDEVLRYLRGYGPVTVGTVWRGDMFRPDAAGVIHATGAVVGGHAYRLIYADDRNHRVTFVNSWGQGWGKKGRAYISYDDVGGLLADGGEAVVAEGVALQ